MGILIAFIRESDVGLPYLVPSFFPPFGLPTLTQNTLASTTFSILPPFFQVHTTLYLTLYLPIQKQLRIIADCKPSIIEKNKIKKDKKLMVSG